MNFSKQIIEDKKLWFPEGLNCINRETFLKDNPNADKSIFETLDFDGDGYIEEDEYATIQCADEDQNGILSKEEIIQLHKRALGSTLDFARRNIDKWFTCDVNRDGVLSNVEHEMTKYRSEDCIDIEHMRDGAMSNAELARKYNMTEENNISWTQTLEKHMESWQNYIVKSTKNQYGIELSPSEIILIQKEMIKQLNTWLFKIGDNATGNAPLYNSLNVTSYTRLLTDEDTVSCCGGDVVPPPMAENKNACERIFSPIEKEGQYNSSKEMKNRLAWAVFETPPRETLATGEDAITLWQDMSDNEYAQLHQKWIDLRSMTANDFRELLKPENEAKKEEFEEKSYMTVGQIVQYIDIVESVTGKPWDSDDWKINNVDFIKIRLMVNDTLHDEELLHGKTRADVPENRKALLQFLEEKGWLYEQFK
ncbi:hypothetical protein IJ750_02425 [bacterium]|nr:hypothetical protein [bacterium]